MLWCTREYELSCAASISPHFVHSNRLIAGTKASVLWSKRPQSSDGLLESAPDKASLLADYKDVLLKCADTKMLAILRRGGYVSGETPACFRHTPTPAGSCTAYFARTLDGDFCHSSASVPISLRLVQTLDFQSMKALLAAAVAIYAITWPLAKPSALRLPRLRSNWNKLTFMVWPMCTLFPKLRCLRCSSCRLQFKAEGQVRARYFVVHLRAVRLAVNARVSMLRLAAEARTVYRNIKTFDEQIELLAYDFPDLNRLKNFKPAAGSNVPTPRAFPPSFMLVVFKIITTMCVQRPRCQTNRLSARRS